MQWGENQPVGKGLHGKMTVGGDWVDRRGSEGVWGQSLVEETITKVLGHMGFAHLRNRRLFRGLECGCNFQAFHGLGCGGNIQVFHGLGCGGNMQTFLGLEYGCNIQAFCDLECGCNIQVFDRHTQSC